MKEGKLVLIIIFVILLAGHSKAANHTMSWNFEIFNNYNSRQVALNLAQVQAGLVEEDDDVIEEFKEDLERRLFSSVQRNIVDMILNQDEIPYGEFEAGDLVVTVAEDPQTGEVVIEIIDIISGDSTVINYSSDDWVTGYDW